MAAMEVPEKKKRKRMKRLCAQIREQMEFYFGDVNLSKDRFLKQKMDEDKDKYVPLDIFLSFNKMKALTDDVHIIAKALSTSDLLAVSGDGLKVKRVTPVIVREDVDERTVYVEGLPQTVDHDWVKQHFSKFGEVLYVSLPKYKSSGDIKGFAFVEFGSVEAAESACLSVGGGSLSDHLGKFPKINKQLKQLQKRIACQKPEEMEATESGNKKIRRKHEETEDSGTSEGETPCKRPRQNSDKSCEDNKENNSHKTKEDSTVEENISERAIEGSTSQTKTEEVSRDSVTVEDSRTEEKQCKRKHSEPVPDESRESKRVRINEEIQVKETEKHKRKRQRQKRERSVSVSESCKETPQLQVIPKAQWLKLKAEYLSLQKKSMRQLKLSLKSIARRNRAQESANRKHNKADSGVGKELTFMPNVIVKVNSENPSTRKELKERVSGAGEIAYIDFPDGESSGNIRCGSAEVASKIAATSVPGYAFFVLKGDEEQKYWSKILADRQKKRSSKQRPKKRGTHKINEKVEKHNKEQVQRSHVVFDD